MLCAGVLGAMPLAACAACCKATCSLCEFISHQHASASFAGQPSRRKDTCTGDSGGPLLLKDRRGRPWRDIIVGITSFGYKCAGQKPGTYTNVAMMAPWIRKTARVSVRARGQVIICRLPSACQEPVGGCHVQDSLALASSCRDCWHHHARHTGWTLGCWRSCAMSLLSACHDWQCFLATT